MATKYSTVKEIRDYLLEYQEGVCPLCKEPITDTDKVALDHDHETGKIRAVLHNNCNQLEGKITSLLKRFPVPNPLAFMYGYHTYLTTSGNWPPSEVQRYEHPNHITPELRELRKLKRKLKNLKQEKAKERCIAEIKSLQQQVLEHRTDKYLTGTKLSRIKQQEDSE